MSYNFRPSTVEKTRVSKEQYDVLQSLLRQKRDQKMQSQQSQQSQQMQIDPETLTTLDSQIASLEQLIENLEISGGRRRTKRRRTNKRKSSKRRRTLRRRRH